MRKNRSLIQAVIMAIIPVLLFSGCPKKAPDISEDLTPSLTGETSADTTEELTEDRMLLIILDKKTLWEVSDKEIVGETDEKSSLEYYMYAVTDLDNDGYPEVIKTGYAGRGLNSYVRIYEVTNDGSLTEFGYNGMTQFSDEMPDLFLSENMSIRYFDDENGVRFYLIENITSDGVLGIQQDHYLMSVKDNELHMDKIAGRYHVSSDSGESDDLWDVSGNPVSKEEYEELLGSYEARADKDFIFETFTEVTPDNIKSSYQSFKG